MSGIQRSHPVLARRCLTAATGCLAMAIGWHATLALANPTAQIVASGSANFQSSGKTLTVTNTPGAIINWQSFSTTAGDVTRFQQQSAASTALNRVAPSTILGTLSSNGRDFATTPPGKFSAPSMRFDTAGLRAPQIPSPAYSSVSAPQSVGAGSNLASGQQHASMQPPVSLNLAKRDAPF